MKSLIKLLAAGMIFSSVQAGFKIPKSVFRYDKLTEAAAEATEEKKALAFVYTDETST